MNMDFFWPRQSPPFPKKPELIDPKKPEFKLPDLEVLRKDLKYLSSRDPDTIFLFVLVAGGLILIISLFYWERRRDAGKRSAASRPAARSSDAGPTPATAESVFVSFSTKDSPMVEGLIDAMKGEGFSPWVYTGTQDADAGRYATRIVRAIKASRKVAVMCSDHAFQSDEVVRELYVAGKARKPFVAFFLDREPAPDALPEAFEYFLTGFPLIPVKGRDDDALRNDIRRHLGA